jgi:drug/metabolite transporter (DMT)-like permease
VTDINQATSDLRRRDQAAAPHLALIAVQILFGTWAIIGKIALRSFTTTELVALRVGGAAIAFLFLRGVLGNKPITRKSDYARLALYSLLGVVLNQLLFVKALTLTTAINATLLGTTIPVFALIVGIMLGYERASLNKAFGILLAACGVIYLVNPFRADFSGSNKLGDMLLIANSLCYGAYIAISKDLLKRYDALTVIGWLFVMASIVTVPFGIISPGTSPAQHIGAGAWLAVLYIIIAPTVGAYYLNGWALARVAPSTVAVYIYFQPLVAFALAPLILGETWNSRTWIASALIFAGVVIVTRRASNRQRTLLKEVSEQPDALGH